jgi:hypothetical protein
MQFYSPADSILLEIGMRLFLNLLMIIYLLAGHSRVAIKFPSIDENSIPGDFQCMLIPKMP